ncbi:MAG: FG-GAP-like repeat-containing protein, partial [Myxococcota bacterium]
MVWSILASCVPPASVAPNDPAHDWDGDGWTENAGDCDDDTATVHPGAREVCGDGVAQGCDADRPCALAGDRTIDDGVVIARGCPAAAAGDTTGDGFGELIVGDDAGGATVVDVVGGGRVRFDGSAPGPVAVAGLGDVDGDGLSDVAIGVRTRGDHASDTVWVGFGRTSPGDVDLATASGVARMSGPLGVGYAVDGGGDATGDGPVDWAVSAPGLSAQDVGRVWLIDAPPVDGAELASLARVVVDGGPDAGFGAALDLGSDLDGDGLADLVVAAERGPDGVAELVVALGGRDGTVARGDADRVLVLAAPTAGLGPVPVAPGDVDGDGRGDLAVGLAVAGSDAAEVALWFAPLAAGGRADADGVWVGPEGGRLGAA